MADEPISALTQIAAPSGSPPYPTAFTNPTTGAVLEILDTTNTSMAATGTNSKIAPGDLIKGFLNAGTNVTLTETAGVVTIAASGGSPGGTSGQIQTNNGSGGFGALAVPLPVASGGTAASTLTAHAVLLGEGTSAPGFATIGTAGRVLIDQGAGADPSFKAFSGDVAITSTGATAIQSGAVSLSDMANFAASSLMGNPTGSPAAPSAITLGANLSFSGTTLVATAGSGMSNPMTTTGDIVYGTNTQANSTPGRLGIGSTGNVLTVAGGLPSWAPPATSGTVTSVGLSTDSGWMTVGSSPVTSSGTITINKTTGLAGNKVLASPDGTTGTVSLRSLVNGDLTAPGSTGQLIYNSSNVFTGAAKLAVGSSGQLNYVPITAPGSPVAGDLWYDTAMNTFGFISAGMVTQPGGVVWQLTAPATAISSPSNAAFNTILAGGTQIGSLTFPANSLTVGKIININLSGKTTIGSASTMQVKILLGSSIVGTGQSASVGTVTNAVVYTDQAGSGLGLQVQTAGASGKIFGLLCRMNVNGIVLSGPSGGTVSTVYSSATGPLIAQASIDTTVSNTFDIQVAFATGSTTTFQILSGWMTISG